MKRRGRWIRLQYTPTAEVLGQLTGGIAHEFNNILAATPGYVTLARNRPDTSADPKLIRYLQQMVTAGERGRDLVRQMLAFAQPPGAAGEVIAAQPVIAGTCQMLGTYLPAGIAVADERPTQLTPVIGHAGDLRHWSPTSPGRR